MSRPSPPPSIARSAASLLTSRMAVAGIALLFLGVSTRLLTMQEMAVFAVYNTFCGAITVICSLGLLASCIRQVPALSVAGRTFAIKRLLSLSLGVYLAGAAVTGLAAWVSAGTLARLLLKDAGRAGDVRVALVAALCFALYEASQLLLSALQRYGDLGRFNVITAVSQRTISLALFATYGLTGYLAGFALGSLVGAILGFARIRPHIATQNSTSESGPPEMTLRGQVRFAVPFYADGYLRYLYMHADQLLVGIVLSPAALSIFFIAKRFLQYCQVLISSVVDPLGARAAEQSAGDHAGLDRTLRDALRWTLLLFVPLSALLAASSPFLLAVVGGEPYAAGTVPLALLFCSVPIFAVFSLQVAFIHSLGAPLDRLKVNLVAMVGQALSIAGVMWGLSFAGRQGTLAALAGLAVSRAAGFGLGVFYAGRLLRQRLLRGSTRLLAMSLRPVLCSLAVAGVVVCLHQLLGQPLLIPLFAVPAILLGGAGYRYVVLGESEWQRLKVFLSTLRLSSRTHPARGLGRSRIALIAGSVSTVLVIWLAAGLTRVPTRMEIHGRKDADLAFAVRVWRMAGLAGVARPGWAVVPPGLARLIFFPAGNTPLVARIGGRAQRDRPLVSREGVAMMSVVTLDVRPRPEDAALLARFLPAGWGSDKDENFTRPLRAFIEKRASESSFLELASAKVVEALGDEVFSVLEANGFSVTSPPSVRFYPVGGMPADGYAPSESMLPSRRVLLVGLDGADWDIIDPLMQAGRMPNLQRLVEGGARARLRTITPVLSPIIWTSVATGVGPDKHGIIDFLATSTTTGRQIPVTSNMRKVKALWNILSERGKSSGVVAWWASWPAEAVDGFVISDRVAYQLFGFRESGEGLRRRTYPEALALLLDPFIVSPAAVSEAELSRFFDIQAQSIPNLEDYRQRIRANLSTAQTYTGIAKSLLAAYDPDLKMVYFEGTDTIAHNFMRFRPPAMPGVSPAEVATFGEVVDRYYAYQDELLGSILAMADAETLTLVCSDHGFRTGVNRPPTDPRIEMGGAADWHRKFGVLVMNGVGVRRGVVLDDASVLDIAPTVLAAMGLPVADDMDGQVLVSAFDVPLVVARIPTYETEDAGGGGVGPVESDVDQEIINKLTALGYVGQEGTNALNNTGITLLDRGRYSEAAEAFTRAVAQQPRFVMARVNLGRARMLMKEHDEAIKIFNEALVIDPSMAEVHNLLGNIHMDRGDFAAAASQFRKSLELTPDDTHTRNSLGLLYDRLGRDEEALAEFSRVVAIDRDYAEGYNNIGLIHRKRGDASIAIHWFRRAIEADPDFPGSYNNMGLAWQDLRDLKAAREILMTGLEVDSGNPVILNNLGTIDLAENQLEAARGRFEEAIREDPGYASAHNNLGAVLGMMGDSEHGFEEYLRAAEIDPNYADARFNIARHLLSKGEQREAAEMLEKILAIDPQYGKASLQLGLLRAQEGDYTGGLRLTERSLLSNPGQSEAHALRGELLFRLGRRSDASGALEESLRLRPNQPRVRELLERVKAGATSVPSQ